jgi:hypothetical protein
MLKYIFLYIIFAALPQTAHSGHGTIQETEDAIIVEYSGEDDAEVKTFKMVKERDEKQATIDAVRYNEKIEQSLEKKKAREAARNAPGAPREGRKEGDE